MRRPRVLVTRPEPGARRTAERLSLAGLEPVILPLTRIAPISFSLPGGGFDAALVTSAQALNASLPETIRRLPLYAVGGVTAESAGTAGFADIRMADGSAGSLAALVQKSAKRRARLIYFCGKVRRPELEASLAEAGFDVTAVETYDAVPILYAQSAIANHIGQEPLDAVILMSAQSAGLFSAIAAAPEFAPRLSNASLVCFSGRISDALPENLRANLFVIGKATEEALMECLAQRFRGEA